MVGIQILDSRFCKFDFRNKTSERISEMPMDGMEHEETGTLEELGIEFNEIRWLNCFKEYFIDN